MEEAKDADSNQEVKLESSDEEDEIDKMDNEVFKKVSLRPVDSIHLTR